MPVRLEDRVSRLAQKVKVAELVRHAGKSLLHGPADRGLPIADHARDLPAPAPPPPPPPPRAPARRGGGGPAAVPDSKLRASKTSPERQSRTTQSTSWPTSGCKPSIARITRPWPASSPRSLPLSVSDTARSSS